MTKRALAKKYDIHPDYYKYRNIILPLVPSIIPVLNAILNLVNSFVPVPKELKITKYIIPGYNDVPIKVKLISLTNADTPLPALVYFHGGAFMTQASSYLIELIYKYALNIPCKLVYVDYRLLPKHPYPVGLEDCYTSYHWVCENAEKLGIDKNRIAVGGDSAGGALATGVSLLANDRNVSKPCFQMLIYPVTDKRQTTKSMMEFTDTPLWNGVQNKKMWKLYIKNEPDENVKYASPVEIDDLSGLPPTYIEVAEFDPLRDEGIEYAKALTGNGVPTQLIETKRTVHGFEIEKNNPETKRAVTERLSALKKVFYGC